MRYHLAQVVLLTYFALYHHCIGDLDEAAGAEIADEFDESTVFCRWDVNNEKGSMSVYLAKIMVRKYLERIQRPGRRLYQTGGLVGAEDYTTSMDFGLWNRDGVRRIQKQIKHVANMNDKTCPEKHRTVYIFFLVLLGSSRWPL